jgi:hypothetical protein
MVKARPDLFYAFVGTGQVADPATSYAVATADSLRHVGTPVGEALKRAA